jgi:adenosylcobinamide-GDP ribazoletransferase
VAGTVPRLAAAAALLLTAAVAAALAGGTGRPWPQGLLAVGLAGLVAGATTWRATRRFGGITGDVLGAGVELASAAALLVLAAP